MSMGRCQVELPDAPGHGTAGAGCVQRTGEELLARVLSELEWQRAVAHVGLTPRQAQVARLLCAGLRHTEIARRTGLGHNTIRMHLRDIFFRLEVHDRVNALVALARAGCGVGTYEAGGILRRSSEYAYRVRTVAQ